LERELCASYIGLREEPRGRGEAVAWELAGRPLMAARWGDFRRGRGGGGARGWRRRLNVLSVGRRRGAGRPGRRRRGAGWPATARGKKGEGAAGG
jgi:hypothetical protein